LVLIRLDYYDYFKGGIVIIKNQLLGKFPICIGFLIFASTLIYAIRNAYINIPWEYYYIITLLILLLILYYYYKPFPFRKIQERWFLIGIISIFIITRTAWVYFVPTQPFSDFSTYFYLAGLFSKGAPVLNKLPTTILLSSLGYPLILGFIFFIFGKSILVAKIFNIILGAATLIVIYKFCRRLGGESLAQKAATLFILWPTQIVMTSVLASEHLAMFLVFLAFELTAELYNRINLKYAILTGIVLGIVFIVRSPAISAIVAILLVLFTSKGAYKNGIILISTIIIVYLTCAFSVQVIYKLKIPSQLYFNTLIGTNIEANGAWNEADANKFTSFATIADANKFAMNETFRRIKNDPIGIVGLMFRKVFYTWSDETNAIYWSTTHLDSTCQNCWNDNIANLSNIIVESYHIFALGLISISFIIILININLWKHDFWILLIYLILGTAIHMISEAQPRYHYIMEPVLFIIGPYGLQYIRTIRQQL